MKFSAFLALAIFSFANFSEAGDWPKWRGPNANGIADEALPADPWLDNVVWKKDIGTGYASFAVVGEKVIASGHAGGKERVFCFNVRDGSQIWAVEYDAKLLPRLHKGGPSASPVVDGNSVFTISKDGLMFCWNIADGSKVWQRDLKAAGGITEPAEWGYAASPVVLGDLVIVESGKTFALNKKTGDTVWASDIFKPGYGSPAIFGKNIAVLKTDGFVLLDGSNGKTLAFEKWKTSFRTNSTTPIVVGDAFFISTGYNRGCAVFDWKNGVLAKRYENRAMCNHMNNSVLIDGLLVGFDGNAHMGRATELVGMDFASGAEIFRVKKNQGLGCGSVIADKNGKLLILTERGELVTATAEKTGITFHDRAQILGGRSWTLPVLSGGRVFARNAEGDMVCVDLEGQ